MICKYILSFHSLPFHFAQCSYFCAEDFQFEYSHTCYFCFCCLDVWCPIQIIAVKNNAKKLFFPLFSSSWFQVIHKVFNSS